MKNFHFSRRIAGVILALALSVSLSSSLHAKQWHGGGSGNDAPITGMYVFGDSLSDTGNLFTLTGGLFPPPPYSEGRASNGDLWVEYLADELGLAPESVQNYAVAGATTGRENYNDEVLKELGLVLPFELPGLQDEIDLFETDLDGMRADNRALYIVFAGSNDFFVSDPSRPFKTILKGVSNTVIAVRRLHRAGARHIMVVNLPDLGVTPYGRSVDPEGLSFVSAVYNAVLDWSLDGLARRRVKTIRLDAAGFLQVVVANPAEFGFTNVTDAYLPPDFSPPTGDPGEFLFWDGVHPTTKGHSYLADDAMHVLRRKFRYLRGNLSKSR